LWLGAILFLMSTCLAVQPKAFGAQDSTENTATKAPFTLAEIEKLLEGSVTPKRVATLVEQYGVSFELTDEVEQELREVGADDKLLLVISKRYVDTTAQEWEAVRYSNDRSRLEAFLQHHPSGPFADAARAQIEQIDWEAVRYSNDRNQLEAFLQRHPSGPFADAARAQIEQIDWTAANGSNDRSKLQAYLNQHSGGRYAQQAREQIEQIDWNSAFSSRNHARIQAYLAQYPNGRYRQQAREALEQIDWDAIKDSKDVQRLRAFLRAYPQGRYATLAKMEIEAQANVQPPVQTQARPKYCALPDKLAFDYNTPQREKIGIWTGQWNVSPFRRFCIVITSIKGHEVRGIYSWEDNYKGNKADFEIFTGTIEVTKSLSGQSQPFPHQIIVSKSETREITLEFRINGKALATWRRPGHTSYLEAGTTKVK
jgi:outer membrane protein assembly factor BamD (BamD/ComL family)